MPFFKLQESWPFAGADDYEIVEAASLAEAWYMAEVREDEMRSEVSCFVDEDAEICPHCHEEMEDGICCEEDEE